MGYKPVSYKNTKNKCILLWNQKSPCSVQWKTEEKPNNKFKSKENMVAIQSKILPLLRNVELKLLIKKQTFTLE